MGGDYDYEACKNKGNDGYKAVISPPPIYCLLAFLGLAFLSLTLTGFIRAGTSIRFRPLQSRCSIKSFLVVLGALPYIMALFRQTAGPLKKVMPACTSLFPLSGFLARSSVTST